MARYAKPTCGRGLKKKKEIREEKRKKKRGKDYGPGDQ